MGEQLEGRGRELLEAPNFAHVGTVRKDGTLLIVPTWVDVDDGDVILNTAEGRAWPANLRRDPRVTITVSNQENPYEFVSISGTVVGEDHDDAMPHADRLAKKYLGQDKYPFALPGEVRVKFRIRPERVHVQGTRED